MVRTAIAVVGLQPLQQVADLDVGVAVVGVLDLGAAPEQRVRLVEEQQAVAGLDLVEDLGERLLGLADVLGDDLAEVDPVQVEPELAGQAARREGLAGAGLAGEQAGQPGARSVARAECPSPSARGGCRGARRRSPQAGGAERRGTTRSASRARGSDHGRPAGPSAARPGRGRRSATQVRARLAVGPGAGRTRLQALPPDRRAGLLGADPEPRRQLASACGSVAAHRPDPPAPRDGRSRRRRSTTAADPRCPRLSSTRPPARRCQRGPAQLVQARRRWTRWQRVQVEHEQAPLVALRLGRAPAPVERAGCSVSVLITVAGGGPSSAATSQASWRAPRRDATAEHEQPGARSSSRRRRRAHLADAGLRGVRSPGPNAG